MKHRFETVRRDEARFDELISGRFSKLERAIPVQSLQVGDPHEEVTFKIIERDLLPKMSWKQLLRSTIKIRHLLLVLFPLFFIVISTWNKPQLSSLEIFFIAVGLFVSFFAIQLKIDIQDFVSGYDRLRNEKSLQILKSGATSASELQVKIQKLLGTAFGIGMIPVLLEPLRALSLLATLILFGIGYKLGSQKKNRFIRDICLSLLAGPVLAYGVLPQPGSIYFGFVWAVFVFFSLQIDHFQNYFEQTRAGERNLITNSSFDKAPQILWSVWSTALLLFAIWNLLAIKGYVWLGSVLIIAFVSYKWRSRLVALKSPLGSDIEKVCEQGHQLYLTFILLWTTELFFQAWLAPLVFLWAP
jgi:hypothetical protein